MPSRGLLLLTTLAAAGAAVAGVYAGRWAFSPAPASVPPPVAQPADPFAFVLEHPPVVCHDATAPVAFEIPVVNRTAGVVRFANFGCDCGCTSGKLDREELQPGASVPVRMTVNLSGREGAQRFTCHWTDEAGTRWSAQTRVTIYKPAQFDSTALRLGTVAPGDTIGRQVQYDEHAATAEDFLPVPTFSISSIHHEPIRLVANPSVVEPLGAGLVRRRTPVDVNFTVPNRGGYTEVFLVASAPPGRPTQSVRIDWSVPETVELSPARLALTFPGTGEARRTQVVRVRPLGGGGVTIDRITTSDPAIMARVLTAPQSPAESAEVEVAVALPEGKRLIAGDVVLHLGGEGAREVRVPVTALRGGVPDSVERP